MSKKEDKIHEDNIQLAIDMLSDPTIKLEGISAEQIKKLSTLIPKEDLKNMKKVIDETY